MSGFRKPILLLVPLITTLMLGSYSCPLQAHEGPPFPLFVDKPLGEYLVSLWADPDIGEAQFFVIVETPEGTIPKAEPRVAIWTEPTSGRLGRQVYAAARQPLRSHMQLEAKPHFDQQDFWRIGVSITGADGKTRDLVTEVESTPPGLGPWDLAIYLFPFVLLGGLWCVAMIRRRRSMHMRPGPDATAKSSTHTALAQDGHTATGGAQ